MELLLQWLDNLDDVFGAVRHLAPRILGLLAAVGLFAATVTALIFAPHVTLVVIAFALSVSLLEGARRLITRAIAARSDS